MADAQLTSRPGRPQFARLKDVTGKGTADLPATFRNIASLLADAGFDMTIEFHIRADGQFQTFWLRVAGGVPEAGAGHAAGPHLTLITAADTWNEIAAGRLSPLDAFGDGKLRLRGDLGRGSRALRHLAGAPGRAEIC